MSVVYFKGDAVYFHLSFLVGKAFNIQEEKKSVIVF